MNNNKKNSADARALRLKAEEQLKKNHTKKSLQNEETDVKKLLHELQVHQIELEMQNEELRLANETAETALKKYTTLYDFAPMGYYTLDVDGRIVELNFTGAELLGDKHFSLVDSNFKVFVSDKSRPVFNAFLSKVFISQAKESCEILLGNDDEPVHSVYLEGIVIGDDHKCFLTVVDISGFRK